jgi:hypothetical protein
MNRVNLACPIVRGIDLKQRSAPPDNEQRWRGEDRSASGEIMGRSGLACYAAQGAGLSGQALSLITVEPHSGLCSPFDSQWA